MKRYYNIFMVTAILLLGSSILSAEDCVDDATGAYTDNGQSCDMVINTFGLGCDQEFSNILIADECPVSCDTCPADCDANGSTSHGCCLENNSLHIDWTGDVIYNSNSVCLYCDDPSLNNSSVVTDGLGVGTFNISWIDVQDGCEGNSTWNVNYEMTEEECAAVPDAGTETGGWWFNGDIGGFQFNVNGATLNGDAAATAVDVPAGFNLNTNPSDGMVLATSFSGDVISAGCGTLLELLFIDGTPVGISNIIVSDEAGNLIPFGYQYGEGAVFGCMDGGNTDYNGFIYVDYNESVDLEGDSDGIEACNYESEAVSETNPNTGEQFDCTYIVDGECDCDGNILDCAGDCDGTAVIDECGNCGGTGPIYGYDCDGNCNPELINCDLDCFGISLGTAKIDDCYQCIDCSDYAGNCSTQHPAWNASCTDCNGDRWGSAFIDACELCVGGLTAEDTNGDGFIDEGEDYNLNGVLDTPIPACLFDCSGNAIGPPPIPFSFDDCGLECLNADGGSACDAYCDNIPGNDCEVDCNGNWGGYAEIDNCGQCALGETGQQPCAPDCEGVWGGDAVLDECGVCSGGDSGHVADSDNLGCGCFQPGPSGCDNICGSTLENDECGVCGGSGYLDNCLICDDDPENDCIADCEGNWGGDLLDTCFNYTFDLEDETQENCEAGGGYWSPLGFDECGVCDGEGIPLGTCDCFGHVLDECGVCNGEAYFTDSNGEPCTPMHNIINKTSCDEVGGFWSEDDGCVSIPNFDCFYRGDVDFCDCDLNILDGCGVCNGIGAEFGEDDSFCTGDCPDCCEAELDDCGRCFGYGSLYECGCFPIPELTDEEEAAGNLSYCSCPESFNEDGEPEWTFDAPKIIADCAGECGGDAVEDSCGVCNGDDTACYDCTYDPDDDTTWEYALNGPIQNDCTYDPDDEDSWVDACGGSAVYDCRFNCNANDPLCNDGLGFDQSEEMLAEYCEGSYKNTGNAVCFGNHVCFDSNPFCSGEDDGCSGYGDEDECEDDSDNLDCEWGGDASCSLYGDQASCEDGGCWEYGNAAECEDDSDDFACAWTILDSNAGYSDADRFYCTSECLEYGTNRENCENNLDDLTCVWEDFVDLNDNGVWDEGELEGSCKDGDCSKYDNEGDCAFALLTYDLDCVWDFEDLGNGIWNEGEEFTDCDGDDIYQEGIDIFDSSNDLGDGIWTQGTCADPNYTTQDACENVNEVWTNEGEEAASCKASGCWEYGAENECEDGSDDFACVWDDVGGCSIDNSDDVTCEWGVKDFEGCLAHGNQALCEDDSDDLDCEWGAIKECYAYNNIGEWVLKGGNNFDTEEECLVQCYGAGDFVLDCADFNNDQEACRSKTIAEDGFLCQWHNYFWVDTGKDECGVCGGNGRVYGFDGNCCEEDLDECGICGDEIGDTGPGLLNLGNCEGDDGCEEFMHDKSACRDPSDDLTCYWGAWDDCSGSAILDCNNKPPLNPEYVGYEGIFGYDVCGECDGEGAIFGNSGSCCEDYVDGCGGCHEGDCTGDIGCDLIENKAGCEGQTNLICEWTASEYGNPKNDDPSWNLSEYASPDGEEDDGSIYCDCYGNVDDCYGICGGLDGSLSDVIGIEECVGGNYDTQQECEENGKCSGHALTGADSACEIIENMAECMYQDGGADCVNQGGIGGCSSDDGICEDTDNDGEIDDVLTCNWTAFAWIQIGNDCQGECDETDFSCIECPKDDDSLIDLFNDETMDTCAEAVALYGCDHQWAELTIEEACPETCGAECLLDNYGNECHFEDMDVCGLCFGSGIDIAGNFCDCFDNIGNCEGACPNNYIIDDNIVEDISTITGNPGIWVTNEEYNPITGSDLDGDGICDDDDDCISEGTENNNKDHLIFIKDGSITDKTFPAVCLDVCIGPDGAVVSPGANKIVCEQVSFGKWWDKTPPDYDINETQCLEYSGGDGGHGKWVPPIPNAAYGGYDLCGDCNGNGFSCGFKAEGGFKEVNLSWRRPDMAGLADSLGEEVMDSLGLTLLHGINFNDAIDLSATSFYSVSTTDPDEICSEAPNTYSSDTTITEYGLFSEYTPAVKIKFCDESYPDNDCIKYNNEGLTEDDDDWNSKGTIDIYMSNVSACAYCEDDDFNNTEASWVTQKEWCESDILGAGNSTWIIDHNLSEAECKAIPSAFETGGWWFNGSVGGIQFFITGVTVEEVVGGNADEYFNILTINDNADCDADGNTDPGCNLVMGTSMDGDVIPPGTDQLLMTIEFEDFDTDGICFGGLEREDSGNWSHPVISGPTGKEVMVDWQTCACADDILADECGVCGGIGLEQECGCGMEYNCEFIPGACDCTGRMPSATYAAGSLLGEFICWNEEEVCDVSLCTPDPNAVSYNIYRKDALQNWILRADGLPFPHYTDSNLGYEEDYCYIVSYFKDLNQNLIFDEDEEQFIELELGVLDNCGTTDQLLVGCTYPTACNTNEIANYYDGSCWWPTSDNCICEDGQGSFSDACGTCDNITTNDCTADCDGAWGGDAEEDGCGICHGDGSSCCTEEGEWSDHCDTCDDDPSNDCVPDCNGEWGGPDNTKNTGDEAFEDQCGVCSGGNSGHVADSDIDECDVCFGDDSTCEDCAGIPNGDALRDRCGTCDSVPSNDCVSDCNGEWGGPLLGLGIFECFSFEEDSIIVTIDSTACVDDTIYINKWAQIGNDECGICDGPGPDQGYNCEGEELAIINGLIPEEYNINNIYPNPFNPTTNIEFGLPENTYVQIVVYDIQGRQVATLINSFQFAGYYSINWNATANSSGVYFIRMMTDSFKQTQQVILMK